MFATWWLLILLPLAALSGWFVARRPSRNSNLNVSSAYFQGLNFLLNEQSEKAINAFEVAIEEQSNSLDVQLALGNVYRRRGELEKATHIHENLIARTSHDLALNELATFELAQDYFKAGLLDRAEKLFLDIVQKDKENEQACQHLLIIYEQEKEWYKAINVIDSYIKRPALNFNQKKAHYYCELAEIAIRNGRFSDARLDVKKAIKTDKTSVRAVIQLGRICAALQDHEQAIDLWKQVIDKKPQYIREVIELISFSYQSLTNYNDLNAYLKELIFQHRSVKAMLLLTENLRLTHGNEFAQNTLAELLRKNPSLSGVRKLLELKVGDEKITVANKKDILLLSSLLENVIKSQPGYQCKKCGFSGSNFYWHCPSCHTWNSVAPNRQGLGAKLISESS